MSPAGVADRAAARPQEAPRPELLSVERLEERAKLLARTYVVDPTRRRRAPNVVRRFHDDMRLLTRAYEILTDDARAGGFISAPGEWLLDNFHVIAAEARQARHHLPTAYAAKAADDWRRRRRPGAHHGARDGPRPSQRQPPRRGSAAPLSEQLSDGRAAHDRRAVGLAERLDARAHRQPADRDRRSARGASGAQGRRRSVRAPQDRAPAVRGLARDAPPRAPRADAASAA